jgi:hypothetical protein
MSNDLFRVVSLRLLLLQLQLQRPRPLLTLAPCEEQISRGLLTRNPEAVALALEAGHLVVEGIHLQDQGLSVAERKVLQF